jgi:CheY-like chemotaxis protein
LLEQLHQVQKMEAIGQLAGGVAHDFNNLLTIIFAGVEIVRERVSDDPQAAEALRSINDAASEAAGVARSLLTFGREMPVQKKPVNLCHVVEESARLHRRVLPSNMKIKLDTACDPEPWISADPTQLQQILLNLTLNARDAMPEGGTIHISVSSDVVARDLGEVTMACLAVSDTGVGMSEAVRQRLFDPFFTTKSRGQGTGLGMSVVHGIVTEHGGTIEVESELGRGSTITVRFPCRVGDFEGDLQTEDVSTPRGSGECVLIAEDNGYIRKVIASTLRSFGYVVIETADGPSIISAVETSDRPIVLLLIDLDLPQRGGLESLRELRAKGASMPAIVMTGGALEGKEDEIDENTVLLRKPFQVADLGRLIKAMLDVPHDDEADSL